MHFGLKGLEGRDRFGNPPEDWTIILNCSLKKQAVKVLTGFNRVRIWPSVMIFVNTMINRCVVKMDAKFFNAGVTTMF